MKDDSITTKQMLARLNAEVKTAGSQAELARLWGVPYQYVSNALSCTKLPSPIMLEKMKLEPVKTINYRYKEVK